MKKTVSALQTCTGAVAGDRWPLPRVSGPPSRVVCLHRAEGQMTPPAGGRPQSSKECSRIPELLKQEGVWAEREVNAGAFRRLQVGQRFLAASGEKEQDL